MARWNRLPGQLWEEQSWAILAGVAGVGGLVVAGFDQLPTAISLPLLGVFILLGPGCVLQAVVDLPLPTRWLAIPAFGVAIVTLVATAMAWTSLWNPRSSLMLLAVATVVGAAGLAVWNERHNTRRSS